MSDVYQIKIAMKSMKKLRGKMKTFKNLAKLIKESRENHKLSELTQIEVANSMGYNNNQTISNIERGKCGLPANKIIKICKFLNIDIEILKNAIIEDWKENLEEAIKRSR